MVPRTPDGCPAGWQWERTDGERVELARPDGPVLLGERVDTERWRVIYRAEREDSLVVDALGDVETARPPRNLLERTARRLERLDAPDAAAGELLMVEDSTVNDSEWRIQ